MKKGKIIIVMLLSILFLTSCGTFTKTADYSTVQAEQALNKGKDIKNKTVKIKVDKLEPKSTFGYNIETGKHLNFVSEENPDVKKGQTIIVKVKKVKSMWGSYIITYTKE